MDLSIVQNSFHEIQLHQDNNLAVLLILVIEAVYAFGVLLICCEVCQRIFEAYEDCSEMIQQLDWYLFPTTIQRMMPMILNFTQNPIEIMCFGNKPCNRETFKYVSITKTLVTNYAHQINLFLLYF